MNRDDDNGSAAMLGWSCIYVFCCTITYLVIFLLSNCKHP